MDQLEMTLDELLALPVSVPLVVAGRAFGLGRCKSFELAQAGQFPAPVLTVGKRFKVPRSGLLAALGIDPSLVRAPAQADVHDHDRVTDRADPDSVPAA